MNLDQYLSQHGKQLSDQTREYLIRMLTIKSYPYRPRDATGEVVIFGAGLLLFTAETACWWGGPFEGNFAAYRLEDYSGLMSTKQPKKPYFQVREEEIKAWCKRNGHQYVPDVEDTTVDKPIKLYMFGNDDTSWSKFYATRQEALDEVALFETGPLVFTLTSRTTGSSSPTRRPVPPKTS